MAHPTPLSWARDVRVAARTLASHRGFSAAVVLTLALGTGATTATFGVIDGVLLRPLPFAQPDQLVEVYGRVWGLDRDRPDPMDGPVGSLELEAYARESTAFEGFAGYAQTTSHLGSPMHPERLTTVMADHNFFSMLGVPAVVGRPFQVGDPPQVAVISTAAWVRHFGRDPSLPGRTIVLDGRPTTVLGVMPDTFQFPYSAASLMPGALRESRTDLWIPLRPLRAGPSGELRRGRVNVVARLKPGVTRESAALELAAIARRVEAAPGREGPTRIGVRLVALSDDVVAAVRRPLWILLAAVSLVLLAACANVANLFLARAAVRSREMSIRTALGAGPGRLVRLLLTESLLVSLAGGILGFVVARWGVALLVGLGAALIPRAHEIALDWRVFGFTLALGATTGILAGLVPALSTVRASPQHLIQDVGGHSTSGLRSGRMRDALAVAQIALAFVLGLGAALIVREAIRLQRTDTGMVTTNVLTLHLTPTAPATDYFAIEDRVVALPGVEAAGFTQLVPLQNWGWEAEVALGGRADGAEGRPVAGLRYVTPGYFRTLGIPLRQGRGFDERDHGKAAPVVLVNEAFRQRFLVDLNAVGVETDRGTVIGVVGDVRNVHLNRPADPELYYSAAQNLTMASDLGMSLLVRTTGPPNALAPSIRAAIGQVNPQLAVFDVKTMDEVVSDSLRAVTLYRWLIGISAVLALAIAAVGLYGVIAYTAAARIREFAIRLALGSGHLGVVGLVLGRGLVMTAVGLSLGLCAALTIVLSWRDPPLGVRLDAPAIAAAAAVVAAICLVASAVPAIRVARLNPVVALRED
jgi:predicted permease